MEGDGELDFLFFQSGVLVAKIGKQFSHMIAKMVKTEDVSVIRWVTLLIRGG